MNKLKTILLLVLFTAQIHVFSQTKADALKDAQITSKATLDMDFNTVLKHTLPKVVSLMGGQAAALKTLIHTFEGMKTQGFVFEKSEIIKVSEVVKEQGQFRCVVENQLQMKISNQRVTSKNFLLGIYNDAANYWCFVEAKQLKDKTSLETILPGFKTSLLIPDDETKTVGITN